MNSERLYEAKGSYQLYGRADSNPLSPIFVDVENFEQRLDTVQAQKQQPTAYVESLQVPKLNLSYERMFAQGSRWHENVLTFLGVRVQSLEGKTRKITSDDLSEAIENFNELKSHFAGTSYESMFVAENCAMEGPVSPRDSQ